MRNISIIAALSALTVMAGCSKDPETGGGGETSTLATFSGLMAPAVRTSFSGAVGASQTVLWGVNDFILVSDGTVTKKSRPLSAEEAGKASADFKVDLEGLSGSHTGWTVYYPGQMGTFEGGTVTAVISPAQRPKGRNDSSHLGYSGDCGYCPGSGITFNGTSYGFSLTHAPAYLCFLPYVDPDLSKAGLDAGKIRLTNVKVHSSKVIAGAYTLTTGGLTLSGIDQKDAELTPSAGFYLSNSRAEATGGGGIIMAVPPVEGATLDIEYVFEYYDFPTLSFSLQNSVTRQLTGVTLKPGMIYNVYCHMTEPELRYVDLGEYGKWSVNNMGAETVVGYGDYYAWGATVPCNTTDHLPNVAWDETSAPWGYWSEDTNLDATPEVKAKHNAVYADTRNWGEAAGWRLPTKEEMTMLSKAPNRRVFDQYATVITGTNGNSIVLPAAGVIEGTVLNYTARYGLYLTSLSTGTWTTYLVTGYGWYMEERYRNKQNGYTIRPIHD